MAPHSSQIYSVFRTEHLLLPLSFPRLKSSLHHPRALGFLACLRDSHHSTCTWPGGFRESCSSALLLLLSPCVLVVRHSPSLTAFMTFFFNKIAYINVHMTIGPGSKCTRRDWWVFLLDTFCLLVAGQASPVLITEVLAQDLICLGFSVLSDGSWK